MLGGNWLYKNEKLLQSSSENILYAALYVNWIHLRIFLHILTAVLKDPVDLNAFL